MKCFQTFLNVAQFVILIIVFSSVFVMFMQSCTYNISMAHTEGAATDVIDDTATNTPDVNPTVNIPVSTGFPIPKIPTTTKAS